MTILFLHGWNSIPGGVKPSYLVTHGHHVLNPKLSDDDFALALKTAQEVFDAYHPEVVVGSSLGGAVAMNLQIGSSRLILLCPAWKKWGSAQTVKPGTIIIHSPHDDVIPFSHSQELISHSGLPDSALVAIGYDHRLADPEPLATMLKACEGP